MPSTTKSYSQLNNISTQILNFLNKTSISPSQISQIQAQIIHNNLHFNTTIAHNFISVSKSLGLFNSAYNLYTKLIKKPHIFICNTLIQECSHSEIPVLKQNSISMYVHMHKESIFPNNYTYPFVLKSLSDLKELKLGKSVHTHVVKWGYVCDIYVQNSLLNLYASCGEIEFCQQVFDEMPERDVVSWTILIMGYRDCGKFGDALVVFEKMKDSGVAPNRVTMVNALSACANCGALDMGMLIHDEIRRSGWAMDVILGTSLIDMYGKCGKIEHGFWVFQEMKHRNVYTWNAVIRGLALAKSGEEAVRWFFIMERENVEPDEVTLVAVLCACAHTGMVEQGREIFSWLMNERYGFPPGVKHYACMVDLIARSGHLEEALSMITDMPMEPTKSVWGGLLAGCRLHGNQELSEFAAWKLIGLAPRNSAYYVVLANLYGAMGRWNDAEKIRALMKERGLSKDLGSSSVELEDQKDLLELLRSPNLQVLSIQRCPHVTDETIAKIASGCPLLRELDISFCYQISHKSIALIGQHCPNLQILRRNLMTQVNPSQQEPFVPREYVDTCPQDGDSEAAAIAKFMAQLVQLEIQFSKLTNKGLALISEGCINLEHLDLFGCTNVTSRDIANASSNLKQLKTLKKPTQLCLESQTERYGHWQLYDDRFQTDFFRI